MDPRRVVSVYSFSVIALRHDLQKVHGTQSIEILKDLPPVSGKGWTLTRRISGVNENSTFLVVWRCSRNREQPWTAP